MAENPDDNLDWKEQVEYLRGLAQIVAQEGLTELEIEADGVKLTLKTPRFAASQADLAAVSALAPVFAAPGGAGHSPTSSSEEKLTPVVSPMVGVFYRAASPGEANFVEMGDRVERGQTIGLVEAMKVFNEITAESSGVVAGIPAETGQLVETGQPLVLLK